MVKLIIEDDEGKTTVVPLIRDEITIGRKEGNTIRLTERNVSRRHAKLVKQSAAIFIEDLNSYNGIKVNGNKIAGRVAVAEGDRIQIGDYVLGLKLEGAETGADPFAAASTVKMPTRPADAPTAQIESADAKAAVERADTAEAAAPVDADQGKAQGLGQLVCLSNNFPGQEWVLDKPVMVVGRTDDNDIVINHRSISRHHARLTEENGRYTIIDLQSSNGVRINGEEYGKVELRKGDLVDLGHVRLRFVAPGEDFVFSRDASVVDISKGGRSKGGIWAAVVVLLLLGVGFAIWKLSGTPDDGGVAADAMAVTNDDAGRATASPGTEPDPAELVAKISVAVSKQTETGWKTALELCGKLTGDAKTSAQANCEKAVAEKKAYDLFDGSNKALMKSEWCEVVNKRNEIPQTSFYKTQDLETYKKAETNCLVGLRDKLKEQLKLKACDSALAVANQIKGLDASDTEAVQQARDCGATAVAVVPKPATQPRAKTHRPRRTPRVKPAPKPKPTPKPKPAGMNTMNAAKQLLAQAQNAYVAGNHRRAVKLCRQVLQLVPAHYKAVQILGASSCYLRNRKDSQWAYDRVSANYRPLLKKVCLNNGIQLK